MRFLPNLAKNIALGDANYLSVLDAADAYVAQKGLDLPEEPKARKIAPDPQCVTAVSYTHLDVYKRQAQSGSSTAMAFRS